MLRIGVLTSGQSRGTNLQAILDACENGRIDGQVVVVIGSRRETGALERAATAGVPTLVIRPNNFENDMAYGSALIKALRSAGAELVCLCGFMRLLPENVVEAYRGRILNIHPALLPKFGGQGMFGIHVHQAVLAAGESESGCTVHLVDEMYDHGETVLQARVPVFPDDTPETLAARCLPTEHRTYVEAIRLMAERLRDGVRS